MRAPRRAKKLERVLREVLGQPATGAEVGVQFGKTASYLLLRFPGLTLYLVDCYDDAVSRCHPTVPAEAVWGHAMIAVSPYGDRAKWRRGLSIEMAAGFPDNCLDFCFVDAAHDHDSCAADIAAWRRKVRHGGVLAGHDFSSRFRGVQRAVREALGANFTRDGDFWWAVLR